MQRAKTCGSRTRCCTPRVIPPAATFARAICSRIMSGGCRWPRALDPLADVLASDRLYFLGRRGAGAGDPAEVVELPDGRVLVALAGSTSWLLGGRSRGSGRVYRSAGDLPRWPWTPRRQRAYVANTFADSISVVDLRLPKVVAEVRLAHVPGAPARGAWRDAVFRCPAVLRILVQLP